MVDPEFASGTHGVRTIDVLPVDFQVFSDPEDGDRWDALPTAAAHAIELGVAQRLSTAGYTLASLQRWDGSHATVPPRRTASEIRAIVDELGAFTGGHSTRPFRLDLPQPLAATTDADATLYVGGWLSTGPHVGWSDVLRDITTLADTALALSRPRRHGWILLLDEHDHRDRAQLYLAATLVDNHSGELLWHAHRTVEPGAMIDAVARDIRELMAELPAVQPSPSW